MQIAKWLAIAGIGKSIAFGGLDLWAKQRLNPKTLDLQKAKLAAEMEAAKSANEANRRQAEQYMAMLREQKSEERRSKAEDRQMQLLQVLLASTLAGRQQAGQAAIGAQRQMPPMALTTLLRGE